MQETFRLGMGDVARTILEQLGGNKFLAMTGAKDLIFGNYSLHFKLPSNFAKQGINKVIITLEPSDTYKLEFFKVWGNKYSKIDEKDDVYNENLQDVFTRITGLNS